MSNRKFWVDNSKVKTLLKYTFSIDSIVDNEFQAVLNLNNSAKYVCITVLYSNNKSDTFFCTTVKHDTMKEWRTAKQNFQTKDYSDTSNNIFRYFAFLYDNNDTLKHYQDIFNLQGIDDVKDLLIYNRIFEDIYIINILTSKQTIFKIKNIGKNENYFLKDNSKMIKLVPGVINTYPYAIASSISTLVIKNNDMMCYTDLTDEQFVTMVPIDSSTKKVFTNTFYSSDLFKWEFSQKYAEKKKLTYSYANKNGIYFTDDKGEYVNFTPVEFDNIAKKMNNGSIMTLFKYKVKRTSARGSSYVVSLCLSEEKDDNVNSINSNQDNSDDESSIIIYR